MNRAKPALADGGDLPVVEILEFKIFGRHSPHSEKLISRIARSQKMFRRGGM